MPCHVVVVVVVAVFMLTFPYIYIYILYIYYYMLLLHAIHTCHILPLCCCFLLHIHIDIISCFHIHTIAIGVGWLHIAGCCFFSSLLLLSAIT